MTAEATVESAAIIWVAAMRISQLDQNGHLIPGSDSFVTDTMMKVTPALVLETGDEIAVKDADGNLGAFGKHSDIPKWGTMAIELVVPDPYLEQILGGGVVFSSSAVALGAPTMTATGEAAGGQLPASTFNYGASQGNAFGESVLSVLEAITTAGTASQALLEATVVAAGADYIRFYGREPGNARLLKQVPAIGSQATSAASGTGTVATLDVTALTKPIPAGFQFVIAGDTNTPKIVWTVEETAGVGAVNLNVSAPSVTTTIAPAALIPCFVDTGATTPGNVPYTEDLSAGPGLNAGFQAPTLGVVGNDYGVSIELWSRRIIDGEQDSTYPFIWTVFPKVKGLHITTRDYTNANLGTIFEGQCFGNPNWGDGPGDVAFPFDSSKWTQYTACGEQAVPTPSVEPVDTLG